MIKSLQYNYNQAFIEGRKIKNFHTTLDLRQADLSHRISKPKNCSKLVLLENADDFECWTFSRNLVLLNLYSLDGCISRCGDCIFTSKPLSLEKRYNNVIPFNGGFLVKNKTGQNFGQFLSVNFSRNAYFGQPSDAILLFDPWEFYHF